MKQIRSLGLFSLVFLLAVGLNYTAVNAYQVGGWSPDARVPGYLDDTAAPVLITDQDRTVHAFTSQWAGSDQDRRQAIVYRQWSLEKGWTRPVDIILSPAGHAVILGAYLDIQGKFHVMFWGGKADSANIYYANALATRADDASAWSFPELIGTGATGPGYGAIVGDDQGNLIVVYNGYTDGNGVYATSSHNSGYSWSKPVSIFLTNDVMTSPYYIKAFMGKAGKLHVVWGVNEVTNGTYKSIYYDQIDVKTGEWNEPVLLDERPNIDDYFGPSYPAVADNGEYVVVMYNGGNPFKGYPVAVGRPTLRVRLSRDHGQTWGDATSPFPFLVGNSGEHSVIVDSNNNIHALAIMRIDSSVNGVYKIIGGVWHSEFVDGAWSNPGRFVTTISPANLRAVVSQGNVILATWSEDPGGGEHGVWFSSAMVDAPELPIVALPTPSMEPTSIADTMSTQSVVSPIATTITVEAIHQPGVPRPPVQPLIIGILPVILLLLGIVVFYQSKRKLGS